MSGANTLLAVTKEIRATRLALEMVLAAPGGLNSDTRFLLELGSARAECLALLRRALAHAGPGCNYLETDFQGSAEQSVARDVCEAVGNVRYLTAWRVAEVTMSAGDLALGLAGPVKTLLLSRVSLSADGLADLFRRLDETPFACVSLYDTECVAKHAAGRRQREGAESWFQLLLERTAAASRGLVVKGCRGLDRAAVRALAAALRRPACRLEDIEIYHSGAGMEAAWQELAAACRAVRAGGSIPPEIRVNGKQLEELVHGERSGPEAANAHGSSRKRSRWHGDHSSGSSSAGHGHDVGDSAGDLPHPIPPPAKAGGLGNMGVTSARAPSPPYPPLHGREAREKGPRPKRPRFKGWVASTTDGGPVDYFGLLLEAMRHEAAPCGSDSDRCPTPVERGEREAPRAAPPPPPPPPKPQPAWIRLRRLASGREGACIAVEAGARLADVLAAASAALGERVVELWDSRLNGVDERGALGLQPAGLYFAVTPEDLLRA